MKYRIAKFITRIEFYLNLLFLLPMLCGLGSALWFAIFDHIHGTRSVEGLMWFGIGAAVSLMIGLPMAVITDEAGNYVWDVERENSKNN